MSFKLFYFALLFKNIFKFPFLLLMAIGLKRCLKRLIWVSNSLALQSVKYDEEAGGRRRGEAPASLQGAWNNHEEETAWLDQAQWSPGQTRPGRRLPEGTGGPRHPLRLGDARKETFLKKRNLLHALRRRQSISYDDGGWSCGKKNLIKLMWFRTPERNGKRFKKMSVLEGLHGDPGLRGVLVSRGERGAVPRRGARSPQPMNWNDIVALRKIWDKGGGVHNIVRKNICKITTQKRVIGHTAEKWAPPLLRTNCVKPHPSFPSTPRTPAHRRARTTLRPQSTAKRSNIRHFYWMVYAAISKWSSQVPTTRPSHQPLDISSR